MTASFQPTLISIGQVRPNPRWGMAPHRHDFHELIAVMGGRMKVTMPGRQFDARAGSVLFYPAGVWHEERSDPRAPVRTFFISFRCGGINPQTAWHTRDAAREIGTLFAWLFRERHSSWPQIAAWRAALAQTAFLRFLSLVSYREPDLVERSRAFMRERLGKAIMLTDIARAAGLSRFHFARQYKKLSGVSPMDDCRRIKAEAARDLLLDSNLHPKQIAGEIGLANQAHLARTMRRYLGTTPSDFRRRVTPRQTQIRIEDH